MTIESLTTQQKSVLLARAMGWKLQYDDFWGRDLWTHADEVGRRFSEVPDFYAEANERRAWRAINYAARHQATGLDFENWWLYRMGDCFAYELSQVIECALDKALEMFIEHGLVELED